MSELLLSIKFYTVFLWSCNSFSLKLKPVDLRNLSLLASLSLGLDAGLTLTSVPPYAVPFRELAMHVCHHRSLSGVNILAAMDASVVALCTADISEVSIDCLVGRGNTHPRIEEVSVKSPQSVRNGLA